MAKQIKQGEEARKALCAGCGSSHFLFLESFHLTLFSSFLMFEMPNETCFNMNEVSDNIIHH